MSELKVTWDAAALELLMRRDRFTRKAIQQEFRDDPERNAVALDAEAGEYLTRVSDERFAVVWHLDREQRTATVRAVVPISTLDTADAHLKEHVDRAVDTETNR